ncbi:Crp/Fnr family transcriptional regulator [Exiguobacterium aurantiacum]|uniref:Crp/Fnr family transcriptional regulator n=1 Tax=Exiguobacterium aurantiacum TaxID=33987 RepID=A0ABY5FLR9_9BACL|nr:Crp/Fnr family transcriptional regulator [Exiguobacterium aurantiacum]UTT42549.1 Crp/Fnr family transcriptional regulator [Exiguobacterium aurantiacum]
MEQIERYMKQYGLDQVLPSTVRPHITLVRYATGEAICTQGDEAGQLHFLVKGKIRVAHTSAAGKRLVLSFKHPFDLIGDIEYVRRTPFLNTVEAVTPVEMLVVRFDDLALHAKDDVTWLHYLLEGITKKFEMKSQSLSFNLFYPVDVRLASYLLSMTPEETTLGSTVDELTDIADLIGTSYRHVNRTLKRFVEQGLIERDRRSIAIIDRAGLIAVTGESIYE